MVVAVVVRRLAEGFWKAESPRELPVLARLRRTNVADVHCGRALDAIRSEFANAALDLTGVAEMCRLSPTYLSHLLSVKTGFGFQTHLRTSGIAPMQRLLSGNAAIEVKARKSGPDHHGRLDRKFKRVLIDNTK